MHCVNDSRCFRSSSMKEEDFFLYDGLKAIALSNASQEIARSTITPLSLCSFLVATSEHCID